MKNIYYIIWVDSILRYRKSLPKAKDWKLKVFLLNTWVNAINFWTILIWLKFFGIYHLPLIDIEIFPGNILNYFISFTIEFALPFGLLNYFLIFYNDRYKKIIERYSAPKRKYAFIYSQSVIWFALFSAYIYYIWR